MTALKKAAVLAATVLSILLLGVSIFVWRTWDRAWDRPLPDLHASHDPAVISRGEYLVYGPAHCVECHAASTPDADAIAGGARPPLVGGMAFHAPPLGVIYSRNLTPDVETGIGRYTDPQIARLLRYSVRPDGKAVPQLLMPFSGMSDEDIVAILSFLRAQPAVRHVVPADDFTLIGKVVKSFAPVFKPRDAALAPPTPPVPAATRERGEYLARSVGNCGGCHTPHNPVTFAATAPEFSGGEEMSPAARPGADRAVWFRTPNLTPATGSALNKFPDRATFVARFQRGGRQYAGSPMPWEAFARMSDADLGALYEYFRGLPAQAGPAGDPRFRKGS